jgi:Domain of unknown function (DUF6946)
MVQDNPDLIPKLFFGNDTKQIVRDPTDLRDYLPVDKKHYYRDGYSMAEAAKCWVAANGRLPASVATLVGADDLERAHFEYRVIVWGRGRSMTDVMAFVPDGVLALEAKARESLDNEIRIWVYEEERKNPRSPPYRLAVVDRYARALGVRKDELLSLRYQLLHRTLAAALVARRSARKQAWMVVQSFAPPGCVEHGRNRGDFDRYVGTVGTAPVLEGVAVRLAWIDEFTGQRFAR